MKIYLSGPMTGIPDHNRPAFEVAAGKLRAAGYEVFNPGEHDLGEASWEDYLRRDLRVVLDVDGVALLPGWFSSRGARLEVHVARALSVPVEHVGAWLALRSPLGPRTASAEVATLARAVQRFLEQLSPGNRASR